MENQIVLKKTMSFKGATILLAVVSFLFCNSIIAQQSKTEMGQVTERKASFSTTTELSSFEGNELNCYARLVWTTSIQNELDYFEVEWSGDGIVFTSIAEIDAYDVANGGATYNFTDESTSEFNFYRLKMVEINGNFSYSEIIEVIACGEEIPPQIFPNPVSQLDGSVNVKFYAEREEAMIVVMDLSGAVVKRLNLGVTPKSWNNMQLNIADLPRGNYFIVQPGTKGGTSIVIN